MTAAWQSVAARSEGLGTDLVINNPGGLADGEIIGFVGVCGAGQTISKPDASWTTAAFSLGGQAPCFLKVASSEPASWTFPVSGSVSAVGQVFRINAQNTALGVAAVEAGSGAFATSGNLVPGSINSAGADRLLYGAACKLTVGATFTHPASMTERYDTTVASQNVSYEGADEVVGAGATGTRTWTPSAGTSPGVAYMMLIAPVPPEEGTFTGSYDFSGTFAGEAPPAPSGAGRWTPGGRDRFTARRTPKNRRRVR